MLNWSLSLPSFKSLPRFLSKKLKKKPKKLIFTLDTHPEDGYWLNSNSLMDLFGVFWVTSQYAMPIMGKYGNSRASHRRNVQLHTSVLLPNQEPQRWLVSEWKFFNAVFVTSALHMFGRKPLIHTIWFTWHVFASGEERFVWSHVYVFALISVTVIKPE